MEKIKKKLSFFMAMVMIFAMIPFSAFAAETKTITLNFFDEVNNVQVEESTMEVAKDATHVNTSVITLPKGYELNGVTGDLPINDGYVYVGVKPAELTTKTVLLNFYDEVNKVQVAEIPMEVDKNATHVNTSAIALPKGYELNGVTGDLPINDGYVYVGVKPAEPTTKTVLLNFFDEVNNVQVAEVPMEVAKDATHVNTSKITLPEGYELNGVTGDLAINDGYVYVGVKPVKTTKAVILNFYDEVNKVQIAEVSMEVAKDAIHVNTSKITLPEGYELNGVTGDLQINDGWVYVGVKPAENTKTIWLNFYDELAGKTVAEVPMVVDKDAIHVNTSKITLPEGYEFSGWVGDLRINDGWVYVGVKPIETPRELETITVKYMEDKSENRKEVAQSIKVKKDENAVLQSSVYKEFEKSGYKLSGWKIGDKFFKAGQKVTFSELAALVEDVKADAEIVLHPVFDKVDNFGSGSSGASGGRTNVNTGVNF